MNKRDLGGKFAAFLIGDGAANVINMAVLACLLRRITPDNFGYYTLAGNVALWLLPLVDFAMSFTGVRLIAAHPEQWRETTRGALRARLIMAASVAGASVVAFFVVPNRALAALLLAYAPVHLLNALQLDFVLIAFGKSVVYALSRLVAAAMYLAGALLFVRADTPIWIIPIIQAAGIFGSLAIQYGATGLVKWHAPRAADRVGAGPLLAVSFPVALASFAVRGYCSISVLLLGIFYASDPRMYGEYGVALQMVQLATLPMGALLLVSAPHISRGFVASSPEEFTRAMRTFRYGCWLMGLIGTAALVLLGPWLLEWLSGRAMPVGRVTLCWMGFSYLLIGLHSPFSAVLPYMNAGRLYLFANMAALIVGTLAGLILIPIWSYRGASMSWLLSVTALIFSAGYAFRLQLKRAGWAAAQGGPS